MFRFESLEVVHWDYWRRFTLPLDSAIVTVVGPNGSGKTTLLDAFRTLLAIECATGRDYKRYVRRNSQPYSWLRAVVTNPRKSNGQFAFWPLMEAKVTLFCQIRKKGGDWERRYAVAPGDVAIDVAASSDSVRWLGVRQYEAELQGAGLTRAIRRVLALEQGDTDKLCDYGPRQLLELVFNVFGEQEVLDNYARAKGDQGLAQRELDELEIDRAKLATRLEAAEAEVRSFHEWMRLTRELEALSAEWLPRVRIAELMDAINGSRNLIEGQRRELKKRCEQLDEALKKRDALGAEQEQLTARSATLERDMAERMQTLNRANKELSAMESRLKERDRLQKLAEEQSQGVNAEELAQRIDALQEQRLSLRQRCAELRGQIDELRGQIAAFESGRAPEPADVRAFRAELQKAGIAHSTLGDIVSVTDESWQGAVEAVLRPSRHIVLLEDASDRARAFALGERLRFRHYVVPEREPVPPARPGSLLACVKFSAMAPSWLTRLMNDIRCVESTDEGAQLSSDQSWITRSGYHRERRGGRHIGVDDFHFGRAAADQARRRQQSLESQLRESEGQQLQVSESLTHLQQLVSGVDAARQLSDRHAEFEAAAQVIGELRADRDSAVDAWARADEETKSSAKRLQALAGELGVVRHQLGDWEKRLPELRAQHRATCEEQIRRIEAMRSTWRNVPKKWRARASRVEARERYVSQHEVEREIHRQQDRLEHERFVRDEIVIAKRDKLQHELDELTRAIQNRAVHLDRAARLTDDARGQYIHVLRATMRRYGANVKRLGEIAGIAVEPEYPHIENSDLSLGQAGLSVRFDFDQKGMIGLNDGEASGGQQVMKSMILLVGLMMDDARDGGFVFIDEPFAHLDIFNIDKVGAFLAATRAQYILTTPNTHNVNVFKPSDLTLVTQKRKPGDDWAPPVAFMRRARSGLK